MQMDLFNALSDLEPSSGNEGAGVAKEPDVEILHAEVEQQGILDAEAWPDPDPFHDILACLAVIPGVQDLMYFIAQHGRVPFLSDPVKPWKYKGWILPMIMDVTRGESHSDKANRAIRSSGRWRWWLELKLNKTIPAWQRTPPPIAFEAPSAAARQNTGKCCNIVADESGFGMASAFVFTEWLGWATGTCDEPPSLKEETQEHLYRTFCADHWLAAPSDYLAFAYSESKGGGYDPTAFFPTPFAVSKMMVEMVIGSPPKPEHAQMTICEPCVGTGSILIHASNYSVNLFGEDVNPRCIAAAKVNAAFYCPWMVFPVFEGVKPLVCTNVLSRPATDLDHGIHHLGLLETR